MMFLKLTNCISFLIMGKRIVKCPTVIKRLAERNEAKPVELAGNLLGMDMILPSFGNSDAGAGFRRIVRRGCYW